MTAAVTRDQRHTRSHRCPVCGGADEDPRGQTKRCNGFTSPDGKWCHCSRVPSDHQNPDGTWRHLLHDEPRTNEIITYNYRDARGSLVFQVVRKPGKKFLQRRPGVGDEWIWKDVFKGENGARRILYRLPELLAADPAQPVYIVEGEKDADAGASHGLVTTCNPGGAGKWHFIATHAREHLAGRTVIVIADRDTVGELHAADVATSLAKVAASVRVVSLEHNGTPIKDLADFLAAGGTVAELGKLMQRTPTLTAAAKPHEQREGEAQLIIRSGRPVSHVGNVALVLATDSRCTGLLEFDNFRGDVSLRGPLPCPPELTPAVKPTELTKEVCTRFAAWLLREYDLDVRAPHVAEAAVAVAAQHPRHEVHDWLAGLTWDGTSRVDELFVRYFGAADTAYHRGIASCFMLSAVARVFEPGCQHDYLPVLEGPQGSRKSSGLRALFGPNYYSDTSIDLGSKDAFEVLRGLWCQCLDEIDAYERQHVARIKNYVSSRKDRYRPSYGEKARDFPRQIVFAATTNADVYFKDQTGNRRFWPVKTTSVDVEAIEADRCQLWAEAVVRYHADERRYPSADLERDAHDAQDARRMGDPWTDIVRAWTAAPSLSGVRPIDTPFTVGDVLVRALEKEPCDLTRADEMRVGDVLRELGFVRQRRMKTGERSYVWALPVEPPDPPPVTPPDPQPGIALPSSPSVKVGQEVGQTADREIGCQTSLALPALPALPVYALTCAHARARATLYQTPLAGRAGGAIGNPGVEIIEKIGNDAPPADDNDERDAIKRWS